MKPDELRDGYAPVAAAYAEHLVEELAGKPLDRALLRVFAETVKGAILDVGCGPGHVTHYLAGFDADVEGIDLSPQMIEEAQRRFKESFHVADMFDLPYKQLGGIVAFYAIVHTRELDRLIAAWHRALAPGGKVLIAFHAGAQTVHVDELFGVATSLDFMFHEPASVIAALTNAGFVLEARLDRKPYPNAEHPSERTYLLASAAR